MPGWWLGCEEGRVLSPAISASQWHELLQNTGFSGVDSIIHDMVDERMHSFSLIVSQAVNQKFELLREPLSAANNSWDEHLLIIGGATLSVAKTVSEMRKLLSSWASISFCKSMESLDSSNLPFMTSVICLEELDQPLFSKAVTPARLQSLQDFFNSSKNVLWATNGRMSDSPCSNMMVGIGRSLLTELPHLNLQFLDMDVTGMPARSARILVEVFLRLRMSALPGYSGNNMLWKTEPELLFDGETFLVPRVLPNKAMNDRYNAARRLITKTVFTEQTCVEVISTGKSLGLVQNSLDLQQKAPSDFLRISVRYSTMLPSANSKNYYLCSGLLESTNQTALALSWSNASTVEVSTDQVLVLEEGNE